MAKYINPSKIIDLINRSKIQFYTDNYTQLEKQEYGLDDIEKPNDFIRVLIRCLEYEFGINQESEITYNLYSKLSKCINILDFSEYSIDTTLQTSSIEYVFLNNGGTNAIWGQITGNIQNQFDLIALFNEFPDDEDFPDFN